MRKVIAVFVVVGAGLHAQTDPVIEAARKAAAVYAQSLPDYVVKRATSRYRSSRNASVQTPSTTRAVVPRGAAPTQVDAGSEATGWQLVDRITGDVTVEQGREVYTNIQVNDSPAKYLPPGGSWSAGEFSSEMAMVLGPQSEAVFKGKRQEKLRNTMTFRYDFAIDQAHSTWNMAAVNTGYGRSALNYSPAYSARIWIDQATGQAISIEVTAQGLPRGFPVSSVESRTDYDFVKIGDGKFLLPVHSQTVSCDPGGTACLRNETDFRDFNKFEAKTNISFDEAR